MPAKGAGIGKLKSQIISLKHELISSKHCTIFEDSFEDTSTNGTFLALRSEEDLERAQQSGWVEFVQADTASIAFNDYEVQVK